MMETHYKTSSGHQRALVPWFLKKEEEEEEEQDEDEELTVGTESPLIEPVIDVPIRLLDRWRCTIGLSFCELTLV